ncbi:MAG: (d)CMP kinase [Lachnospiraceae bacterium]|nr:(d)CMP kinase [Lachnospiraceae bacterium]
MNIAIDGPAGAGKSTIARRAARELGFLYVDTGAMYRAVALYMINNNIDFSDEEKVSLAVKNVNIDLCYENDEQQILLNGKNVNSLIRTPEVSATASKTSSYKAVRERLLDLQKDIAAKNSVLMDGRDIGTVVLPNAELKIFLTASSKVRGERRYKELIERGEKADLSSIIKDIEKRDEQDRNRAIAPLKQADDAVLVDTSDMSIDEVVNRIIELKNSISE